MSPDPLRARFPRMSTIGRDIMRAKIDRAEAAVTRDVWLGRQSKLAHDMIAAVARHTREINLLACIAAKNW